MNIGYARVSTNEQNLDLQIDALKKAGCDTIYEEYASGKNSDRPKLGYCLQALRKGDVLVVWRLDRLGRNLADLVTIISELEKKEIGFKSLTEDIQTVSSTGKLIFHIFAALADFERNLIRERTMAGLKSARARGRKGGRPRKLNDIDIKHIKALLADPSVKVKDVAKQFNVTVKTIYDRVGIVIPRKIVNV